MFLLVSCVLSSDRTHNNSIRYSTGRGCCHHADFSPAFLAFLQLSFPGHSAPSLPFQIHFRHKKREPPLWFSSAHSSDPMRTRQHTNSASLTAAPPASPSACGTIRCSRV